jgi:HAMP domain-containing protein
VGKFAVALLLVTVAVLFLLFGVFRYLLSREGGPPAGRSQVAATEPAKAFPQPQLQANEVQDLKAVRAAEDQVLNGYAWMDPEKGVVRIPINRAIDLLVERGLPSRPPAGEPK